ncbi:MAG: CPBP family intramembrane glutamic endopeptidase [Actinomycetota bacterium]
MSEQGERTMRVQPRPIVGIAIFVLYAVVFSVGFLASGIDYDQVGDTTSNVVKAIVIPVGVGALVLLLVTHFLGWWRPVFRDEDRAPRWTLLIPAFMAAAVLVGLATADWGARDSAFIVWLLVGTLFVGIAEETLTRGLLLVGFRGGMGEVGVWFWTSLVFGALHGLNILFGQSVGDTVRQIVFAFVIGSVLYACRRATGLLLVPIVIHWLWDFATFMASGSDATASTAAGLQGIVAYGAVIVLIVALIKRSLFRSGSREASVPEPTGALA